MVFSARVAERGLRRAPRRVVKKKIGDARDNAPSENPKPYAGGPLALPPAPSVMLAPCDPGFAASALQGQQGLSPGTPAALLTAPDLWEEDFEAEKENRPQNEGQHALVDHVGDGAAPSRTRSKRSRDTRQVRCCVRRRCASLRHRRGLVASNVCL